MTAVWPWPRHSWQRFSGRWGVGGRVCMAMRGTGPFGRGWWLPGFLGALGGLCMGCRGPDALDALCRAEWAPGMAAGTPRRCTALVGAVAWWGLGPPWFPGLPPEFPCFRRRDLWTTFCQKGWSHIKVIDLIFGRARLITGAIWCVPSPSMVRVSGRVALAQL